MKLRILTLPATIVILAQASAAPDFVEIHERVVDHLKAVRDTLVPAPIIDFVEGFPPIAIPRAKILRLAQAEPVPPPVVDVDAAAIADWANNFAAMTTERTLNGLFPRSAPRRPVLVGGDRDVKAMPTMEEDLNVMMRILEKAAGGRDEEKPRAMGIDVFAFGRGGASTPRVFYIDDYGAMFVLNVKYPLLAPPKRDERSRTNEPTSSEWDKAREEVYGRRNAFEELRLNAAPVEEFDDQRVENLKQQIIDDLANATHMKSLKSDDYVTVVVVGGGSRGNGIRREGRGAPRGGRAGGAGGRGGEEFHGAVEVNPESGEALPAQSTMTIRAKKSDIDAFAKGKLKPEEFRKKVSERVH